MGSLNGHEPQSPGWDAPSGETAASLRRLASRRRVLRGRLRRVVPSVIVGSTTLLGTGALVSWVATQPGLTPSTTITATAPPATVPSTRSNEAALRAIQARTIRAVDRQLAAEVAQLKSLDKDLATLAKRRAAPVAQAGAGQSGGGQSGGGGQSSYVASAPAASSSGYSSGASSLAPISIPSVAPIAIPSAPAALPAPPVAAATGGSHP